MVFDSEEVERLRSEATAAGSNLGRSIGIYEHITVFLREQSGFLYRTGALCLVLLGVHASADWVDDKVFFIVDLCDSGLDALVFVSFEWLGSWSFFSEITLQAWAFRWAEWIGPEEKEFLSLLFAMFSELLVDILIVSFAWGVQSSVAEESSQSDRQRLGIILREMRKAMRTGDLELVFMVQAVLLFSISGALVAGQGLERLGIDFWLWLSPNWYLGRLSASLGLLFVCLVLKRMLPRILLGAVRRQLKRNLKRIRPVKRFRRFLLMAMMIFPLAFAGLIAGPGLGSFFTRIWGGW